MITLDAALAEPDPDEFIDALMNLDPRYAGVEPAERPDPLKRFACLAILYRDAKHEGMWKFLSQEEGRAFDETLEFCRELQAERAVEYLESVASLYPRRRVPIDLERRSAVVERLGRQAQAAGAPDPFRALDERYRDAMPAIAHSLRQWILVNRATVNSMLALVPAPARILDELETLKAADRTLAAAVARKEGEWAVTRAKLSDAAHARGMLPWDPTGNLAALERFVGAAATLTDEQWKTVAARRLAHPRIARRHEKVVWHVQRVVRETDLVDRERFKPTRDRIVALCRSLDGRLQALPEQVMLAGRAMGLRHGAAHAFAEVARAISMHDWIVLTPEGERAASASYAIFDGLAPCPQVKSPHAKRKSTVGTRR